MIKPIIPTKPEAPVPEHIAALLREQQEANSEAGRLEWKAQELRTKARGLQTRIDMAWREHLGQRITHLHAVEDANASRRAEQQERERADKKARVEKRAAKVAEQKAKTPSQKDELAKALSEAALAGDWELVAELTARGRA